MFCFLSVQLLGDEYARVNPDELEATGILTTAVIKGNGKTADAQKKIAGKQCGRPGLSCSCPRLGLFQL